MRISSALRRNAALADIDRDTAPSRPPGDREVLAAYIDAFERNDIGALVDLLRRRPRNAPVRALDAGARAFGAGLSPLTP